MHVYGDRSKASQWPVVNAPMLPVRFSARTLPPRGQSRVVGFRFNSQSFDVGEYELKLEFKTPSGETVEQAATKFEVVRNLLVMDLKAFETIRVWHGRGADATLEAQPKSDPDAEKQLVLGRDAQDQVVCLRFDLMRWNRPVTELGMPYCRSHSRKTTHNKFDRSKSGGFPKESNQRYGRSRVGTN